MSLNDARPELRFYDAHNHLQDERLKAHRASILMALAREEIRGMVVNGCCEADWPEVLALARESSLVLPSFGYHPWYMNECSPTWLDTLRHYLDLLPSGVGEIGLDRWIKDYDWPRQQAIFAAQLRLAAERNRPASIHCLQAWGRLLELLKSNPRPACGFVLHSFGGPREMIPALTELGAYFSLPGYFAHARKVQQRETFLAVPADRLLIETDAPDQRLPPERTRYPLTDPGSGQPLNHPANLPAVYEFAAELLNQPIAALAEQVERNFWRLFGSHRR